MYTCMYNCFDRASCAPSAAGNASATLLCLGSLTTIAAALRLDAELMRNKVSSTDWPGNLSGNEPAARQDSEFIQS